MKLKFNKIDTKLRKIANNFKILKVDKSFWLIFVLAVLLDEVMLYLWFSIFTLLHELVHFLVAKKLGYSPQKIHLTFFGASLEGCDDFLFDDEIKIVLAGPLFNLLVVVFCYLSFWFEPESFNFLNEILVANLSIFLFNFLPIYPLDFGRFLLAVFSKNNFRKNALEKVKRVSFLFVLFLFVLFLLSIFFKFNFTFGFVCVNLVCLLFTSSKDTSYTRQIFVQKKFEKIKKGLIERKIFVDENIPFFKLFKFIDDNHFVTFVFLDSKMKKVDECSEIFVYEKLGLVWIFYL